MATSTAAKRTSKSKAPATSDNAISLLKADHQAVAALFEEFDGIKDEGDPDDIAEIVQKACAMLRVHTQIEEEIFYPAVRDGVDEAEDLLNEAEVEHGTVKDLIERLEEMDPADDMYAANFTVVSEYVKHHVKEEESELFPKVIKSDIDLEALGAELLARKEELEQEDEEEEETD